MHVHTDSCPRFQTDELQRLNPLPEECRIDNRYLGTSGVKKGKVQTLYPVAPTERILASASRFVADFQLARYPPLHHTGVKSQNSNPWIYLNLKENQWK